MKNLTLILAVVFACITVFAGIGWYNSDQDLQESNEYKLWAYDCIDEGYTITIDMHVAFEDSDWDAYNIAYDDLEEFEDKCAPVDLK